MKEAYIVVYQHGYGEDYRADNISVCFDKQKAQEICDRENKLIELTEEFFNQIESFKEEEPRFDYQNESSKEYEDYLKQYWDIYDSWRENLHKFQLEQMKCIVEKSDISKEMKEKILVLSTDEYSFLNHNKYVIDVVPLVDN